LPKNLSQLKTAAAWKTLFGTCLLEFSLSRCDRTRAAANVICLLAIGHPNFGPRQPGSSNGTDFSYEDSES